METKPTYEELERDVDALRQTVSEDEYLEQVYHSIGQSIIILDPDQNILFANLATEKITGLSSNELKGKKCYQVFHYPKSTSPPESCPMQKALSTGKVETMEMEVETASGTFLISCTPVFDHNSKLITQCNK
jgi:PAS domain S-box-containing protein